MLDKSRSRVRVRVTGSEVIWLRVRSVHTGKGEGISE